MNMRTVLLITIALATASVFVGTAAADPCNGLTDSSCECKLGTTYCAEGETCARYVAGICVDGSNPY